MRFGLFRQFAGVIVVTGISLVSAAHAGAKLGMQPQAQPRQGAEPRAPQTDTGKGEERRAKPRPPAAPPEQQGDRREPGERPGNDRERDRKDADAYRFHPVGRDRAFFYHPYFGFYYGPSYGPFYPRQGTYLWPARLSFGGLRLRVRPAETQVFVNGYYAGLVDDFDGVFQRLYLPPGQHELEFYLRGYRTVRQSIFVAAGGTRDLVEEMERLAPGEVSMRPTQPRSLPEEWTGAAGQDDSAASPFGVLAISVEPANARLLIDGEAWVGRSTATELVIHLPAGWHQIEVQQDGFRTFRAEVDLFTGIRTRIAVHLEPAQGEDLRVAP